MKSLLCALLVLWGLSFAAAAHQDETAAPAAGMSVRLELFVDDVQESLRFYTDVLGFEKLAGDRTYQPVRSGSVVIGLGPADRLDGGHHFNPELQTDRRGLGTEIVLEVDDVRGFYERVQRSRYRVLTPLVRRPWGLTDFRIADPDGYYLRITSRK